MELIKIAEIVEGKGRLLKKKREYLYEGKNQGYLGQCLGGSAPRSPENFGIYDYLDIPTYIRRGVSLSFS